MHPDYVEHTEAAQDRYAAEMVNEPDDSQFGLLQRRSAWRVIPIDDYYLSTATPTALSHAANMLRKWAFYPFALIGRRAVLELWDGRYGSVRVLSPDKTLEALIWEGWQIYVPALKPEDGDYNQDHIAYSSGQMDIRFDSRMDPELAWVCAAAYCPIVYGRTFWTHPHSYREPSRRLDAIIAERDAYRIRTRTTLTVKEEDEPPSPVPSARTGDSSSGSP
jgi:hypothetical protein